MTLLYLIAKIAAVLLALVYAAVSLYLYVNQQRFLFPGAFLPLPAEMATFADGSGLVSTVIPAAGGDAMFALVRAPDPGKPVVILFHGNGSYPESYGFLYGNWIASGYGIVAPAARGYPRSQGTPDGELMRADAIAIHDWVEARHPGHPIVVFGHSLGTSSAIHVAAHRKVAGVVLVSPFASMLALVRDRFAWLPIALLLKSPFRSDLDMPDVTAPTLIFQGDGDDVVPLASARQLADLARAPVEFNIVTGAGHGIGMFDGGMIDRIDAFIGSRPDR